MCGRGMRVTLGVGYCGRRREGGKGRFMDAMSKDMQVAGVTEVDAENKQMETGDQL